jgi:hypothetical protein
VLVTKGLTGEVMVVVNAASEYQFKVLPDAQVAFKVDDSVSQIGEVADTAVGDAGVGVTVIITGTEALLQVPFKHAA